MHDPSVVVTDIISPIPNWRWKANRPHEPAFGVRVRRRTNVENRGERVYPWWRPAGFTVFAFGRRIRLATLATLWHEEPGGADSGTVCGHLPSGTNFTAANMRWAWRHREHIRLQWRLGAHTWRWLTRRCSACGHRLGYREAWFSLGGWDSPESGHGRCADLRHVKGQRDDALKVAMGVATETESWRTQYLIRGVADAFAAAEMGLDRRTASEIRDAASG